jgi:hypothetical protein
VHVTEPAISGGAFAAGGNDGEHDRRHRRDRQSQKQARCDDRIETFQEKAGAASDSVCEHPDQQYAAAAEPVRHSAHERRADDDHRSDHADQQAGEETSLWVLREMGGDGWKDRDKPRQGERQQDAREQ